MSAPSAVIAGHEAFRAALSALAHPGRPFALGRATSAADGIRALVGALYEATTPMWTDGAHVLPWDPCRVAAEEAQVLLVHGASSRGALARAPRGSEAHPSRAATVLYAASSQPVATAVTLRGPGVDGTLVTGLALTAAELAERATVCARRPLGVDVLLIGADGRVTGLPRSTRVEVTG